MGRNTADFNQDANAAFDKVQIWRDELSSSKPPSIKYKNKRQNFRDRKPATNYGAKNGNSKEARAKRAENAKE
jgi:hypothetical protein